jgi:hypothetical protein
MKKRSSCQKNSHYYKDFAINDYACNQALIESSVEDPYAWMSSGFCTYLCVVFLLAVGIFIIFFTDYADRWEAKYLKTAPSQVEYLERPE